MGQYIKIATFIEEQVRVFIRNYGVALLNLEIRVASNHLKNI